MQRTRGNPAESDFHQTWRAERARLIGLAARVLGERELAEDAVQEAFMRLVNSSGVENPAAWLNAVTTRICLDHLKSAAARHEMPTDATDYDPAEPVVPDPADRVTLDESIRAALFVVLDRLSPEERVSLILHDVFSMTFRDVAALTGRSPEAARQNASRARRRIADQPATPHGPASADSLVVEQFMTACNTGKLDDLLAILHTSAWGRAEFTTGSPPIENTGAPAVAQNLIIFLRGARLVSLGTHVFAFRGLHCFATLDLTIAGNQVQSIATRVDPDALSQRATR
ncbi:MAG: sigma-70 family RNA polymerase sigma factor [Jatrophihabitans sp.]